jgi:hypothetical protein
MIRLLTLGLALAVLGACAVPGAAVHRQSGDFAVIQVDLRG